MGGRVTYERVFSFGCKIEIIAPVAIDADLLLLLSSKQSTQAFLVKVFVYLFANATVSYIQEGG